MTFLGALAAVIVATKLLGEVAQRVGQPAVLGELLAGVLLGAGALGVLDPQNAVFHALAEIGVLVLLFQIGLHTDVKSLRRVGGSALTVAAVGVLVPFAGGYAAARVLGVAVMPALVVGAALTATSIGISARVLGDLGRLHTSEGQVVLGAAVADDVIGLVILSVVSAIIAGTSLNTLGVARITAVAVGFIVLALLLGSVAIPPLFRVVERIRLTGAIGLIALAFALALSLLAESAGSATIIGAFAAGLILHPTPQRREIEASVTSLGHFFVPVFFASVGASVDLHALATPTALLTGGALIAVGAAGKVVAGFAPWWFQGDKLIVGVAMVPRGEVGLIFAQRGLASGSVSPELFGALMLMVAVTTLVTPPLVGMVASRRGSSRRPDEGRPGDGGLDDLVAGTHQDAAATRQGMQGRAEE